MTGRELIELIKNYHLEDYTLDWCEDHSTADGHHQQLQFFISEKPTEFVSAVGEPIRKLTYVDVDIYENTGFCKVRSMLSDTPSLFPEHDYTPIIEQDTLMAFVNDFNQNLHVS